MNEKNEKGLFLSYEQARVLAMLVKYRRPDGWCDIGSKGLAQATGYEDGPYIQGILERLLKKGYIEQPKEPDRRLRVIPVRITKKGHEARLVLFGSFFPDIKSVLLRKP
jgi:DNA-binding MarR family transcriptional regulator